MKLDPQIAALIDALDSGFPPVETMTGAQARSAIRARFVPDAKAAQVRSVANSSVPGPAGSIPVRVYTPAAAESGPVPILVYAHGGGFVFCDLDSHDELCRALADSVPAVVVSVDYRLAPENPWPAAAEDLYAATCWAATNADSLGGDSNRLVVGGDSAGGNLAAVTALMARDNEGPALAAQLLLYPVIAADFNTQSHKQFGKGYYNPTQAIQWYWDQYVPRTTDRSDPYASPLKATLSALPPAVVAIAGHDPLRDEGIAFAQALRAAGVPTLQQYYEGGIHGFMTMPKLDLAQHARAQVCRALAKILTPTKFFPKPQAASTNDQKRGATSTPEHRPVPAAPVYVVDTVVTQPGLARRFLEAMLTEYAPAAAQRGMSLHQVLLSPPVWFPDRSNTLNFTWQLDSPEAWWQMTWQSRHDTAIVGWWDTQRELILSRSRIMAAAPADIDGLCDV